MRVVNDRQINKPETPPPVNFLTVAGHALLTAFGISSFLFAPLSMIWSETRLAQPWPKLAALLGAIFALTVLKVPPIAVVVLFVFGLYVAEGVRKETPFWELFIRSMALISVMSAVLLVVVASTEGMGVVEYWKQFTETLAASLKSSLTASGSPESEGAIDWTILQAALYIEGPFLAVSGAILSFWISIGFGAHLGWFNASKQYAPARLRALQLPQWFSLSFLGLFILVAVFKDSDSGIVASGVFRVVATLLFVQGCSCLSSIMELRGAKRRTRTLIYCIVITLGFYAVVGLGVIYPWLAKRHAVVRNALIRRNQLEEGT